MTNDNEKLSRTCIDILHSQEESTKIDALLHETGFTSMEIIEILAHYQYVSDTDDDNIIDPWLDSLAPPQKKILQVFEMVRGRIEQAN